MNYERCDVKWQEDAGGYGLIHASCIRKPGHEGNHVSYPSGSEFSNTPQKKIKDKTNVNKEIQPTS